MILAACGLAGYQIGVLRGHGSAAAVPSAAPIALGVQPDPNPSLTATAPAHEGKNASADDQSAAMRSQARLDQGKIASLNDRLNQAERELADRSADLDRSVEKRTDLNRKLAEVQSDASSLEARLSLIGKETSEDTQQSIALKGQVNDLHKAI